MTRPDEKIIRKESVVITLPDFPFDHGEKNKLILKEDVQSLLAHTEQALIASLQGLKCLKNVS